MKTSLRLSTRQQLALTPQVQQAIRMLQLGAKELSEEIDETLTNNPLLQESRTYQNSPSQSGEFSSWLENQPISQAITLDDHLIRQLQFLRLASEDYVVTCIVIASLDDDGYLRKSTTELTEICRQENITASDKQINRAITLIQHLDPGGIGCRDLTECLQFQIKQQKTESVIHNLAIQICAHLDLLAKNKDQLQHLLNASEEAFHAALELIRQLDPAPGKVFEQQAAIYIQPDIILIKSDNQYSLQLNPAINRSIELNTHTINLLKTSDRNTDKQYLRANLDKAKWWLNALLQRNKTLYSVAKYMINHQLEFFDSGDMAQIKPLKQQQISAAIGIHISTVSRAVRDKHIQSPTGIIPLKQLLAGTIRIDNEKVVSNQAVKSIIINLIKNEPSQTPLSDSKIVLELKTRGIVIARRTVNKYREQLNIPASNRRKVINT